jgi:hypothetical protein
VTPLGRYYHVSPRFWRISRDWSEDARTLALYLSTCSHRNMVALYYCPVAYMTADLGWDLPRLTSALDELVAVREYVRYDAAAEVVFVPQAFEDDPPGAGKQTVGAVSVIRELPDTSLLEAFLDIAQTICPELAKALGRVIEAASKPHRSRIEAASEGHESGIEAAPIPEPDSRTRTRTRFPEEPEEPSPPLGLTEQEREILRVLRGIDGYPFSYEVDVGCVRKWLVRFPHVDLAHEADKCLDWWAGKPQGNWRSRLRNWLEKAEKEAQKQGARAGPTARGPTAEEQTREAEAFLSHLREAGGEIAT